MRKVVTQFMISIDGFFEGPTREIDWHNVDAELHNDVEEMLKNADILLFGRVTYEMMAKYWPTEYAVTNDASHSKLYEQPAQNSIFKNAFRCFLE